ncbi:MAG TPA: T9SS type A sorting domain-containing protein [Salinivirgaceae bacterium]|nr:T9SS type A sorting domain-containing protein [Salinivirgaceae bacterium]HQA76272.1 T9SS type A sorting domain-containing protein [Salinivirgaceae bacterium]
MRRLALSIVFLLISISLFSQYVYVGHDGSDCSSEMTVTYTYTNYAQGNHGHGYRIYRDGVLIRSRFEDFGGYSVVSLDFLNDSVGFLTENYKGISFVYRTLDYGENWERFGGASMNFHDIYFVNQYTAYFIGREYHLPNNVTIVRMIRNNPRRVFSIDTVTTQITNYYENDTIMGEPLCENQQNLKFTIRKSGTDISFNINFNHIISQVQCVVDKSTILLFPNPAKDIINIETNYNYDLDISIFDSAGKFIKNEKISNRVIDVSGLESGLYFLTIKTKESNYTKKFIKE